jgi:phage tail-like protein
MVDVNGTRFHLLFGSRDWKPLETISTRLEWDEKRSAMHLLAVSFYFPTPPGDYLPRPDDRRGAGCDRYGNWYWIAPGSQEIRFLGEKAGQSEHFWSAQDWQSPSPVKGSDFQAKPPWQPEKIILTGLGVTRHHYLAAGTLDPAGLLIFDLHGGGAPTWLLWPDGEPFVPFDIAPAPNDGLWVLDRANRRYWHLDSRFRVVGLPQEGVPEEVVAYEDFAPEGGTARARISGTFPACFNIDEALRISAAGSLPAPKPEGEPIGIEGLPDGSVLVLTTDPAYVYRYQHRAGKIFAQGIDINAAIGSRLKASYTLRGHDLAFVPDNSAPARASGEATQISGTLYLVASDGNQSFGFHLSASDRDFQLEVLPNFYPMRLFAGKALVTCKGRVYYDLPERWVALFEQPRPRFEVEGFTNTDILDGKEPGCTWHRLFVDACIPPGAEIIVETRASDQKAVLDLMPWQREPALYRRSDGVELPYLRDLFDEKSRPEGFDTWELLFQRAVGQYMQIHLTLRGTGKVTPRIYALRAYYPRFSYLKEYLPAVYQADPTSASFLDRYLANVEGIYTAIEGRIEQVQAVFDVHTAPTEALQWLASWLGAVLDPAWEDARRRLFLQHAMQIFAERGTLSGLIRAVRLAVDACPDASLFKTTSADLTRSVMGRQSVRVVEQFLTRSTPGVVYGDPSEAGLPVVVQPDEDWTPAQGAGPLHERFRAFLMGLYPGKSAAEQLAQLKKAWGGSSITSFSQIRLSPVVPANEAAARDWRQFIRSGIGFTYAEVTAKDEQAYQLFLARRYGQVNRLNDAYQRSGSARYPGFYQVRLPVEGDFPESGVRLRDWIQFVSLLLPIQRSAHRFSVLVPVFITGDLYQQEQRIKLVQRIVDAEKPAHTNYEIKPYWALFRVGEARLGMDTVIAEGSRFVALVLGQTYLAEGTLGYAQPFNITDRVVTGRDRPGPNMVL